MKVKIGDKIYDSREQPIMVILSEMDKDYIATMGEKKKYCCYPLEGYPPEKIRKWMEEEEIVEQSLL